MKNSATNNLKSIAFYSLVGYAIYTMGSIFLNMLPASLHKTFLIMGGGSSLGFILLAILKKKRAYCFSYPIILALSIFSSLLLTVIFQAIFLDDVIDGLGRSALGYAWGILPMGFTWMLWGATVQGYTKNKSLIFSVILLVIVAIPVYLNTNDNLLVQYGSISDLYKGGSEVNHLIVADSTLILLILAFSFSPSRWRWIVVFVTILVLFSLGGRTALYIYLVSIGLYLLLKNNQTYIFYYLIVIVFMAVLIFQNFISIDIKDEGVMRMFIADGVGSDASAQARESLLLIGIQELPKQIFIGDPTFPVRIFGSTGGFIHNILSSWQYYGLIPFLIFISSLIVCGVHVISYVKQLLTPIEEFGAIIFIYAALSVLFAKSIAFLLFWFALGFWLPRIGKYVRVKNH